MNVRLRAVEFLFLICFVFFVYFADIVFLCAISK
jgi:hypothetical protein